MAGEGTIGAVQARIRAKLEKGLAPSSLAVIDESHRHAGHAGHDRKGESHFRVEIVSEAFAGKPLIQRHRLVNSLLAEELAGGVHALAIEARTPDEAKRPA